MRRRWACMVLIAVMFLSVGMAGRETALAIAYRKWLPSNDGLWGSEITTLWTSGSGLVLAGTAREGIWATTDQGATWHWSGEGIPKTGLPQEPAFRRIVCLQGVIGNTGPIFAGCDPGLFVSRDGGRTWTVTGSGLTEAKVSTIAVDPTTPNRMYAGTADGVFVSTDAGASWKARNDVMRRVSVLQISFDTSMPDAVLAACTSGVFKSLDRGETWRSLSTSLTGMTVQCIVQDPKRSAILFAGTPGGIYRSYDSGDHWTLLDPRGPRPSTLNIHIDSFDVAILHAITNQGTLVSNDGGEKWTVEYPASLPVTCGAWQTSVTGSDAVLGCSRGVIFVSGSQGQLRAQDMGFLDVTAVAYDPSTSLSYAVRESSLYSSDGSRPWQVVSPDLGNAHVYGFAIDHNEPRLMYAATEYGVLRSTDGGKGWISLAITPSDVRGRIQTVALDPTNGIDFVYAGNDYGLYRSDRGFRESWVNVGPANAGAVVGIAAYAGDRNVVYLLTAGRLWKTTDYCKTWAVINDRVASMSLTSLAIAENDPALLYAGSRDGVWTSADGGLTWGSLRTELRGLLVNSVVPGPHGQLLAGTNDGFYGGSAAQDRTPPVVQVEQPRDGAQVEQTTVTVSGTATDGESGLASIIVGGQSATVGSDGHFSVNLALNVGLNAITIEGRDAAGNVSSQTIHVTYRRLAVVLTLQIGSTRLRRSNGSDLVLDAAPVILRSRTFLPIRAVVEALGGQVGWDAAARMARVEFGGHRADLTLGSPWAIVDGKRTAIDAADASVVPVIVAGRTLLPVRFVAESLGCTVTWDAATKTITVTSG